MIYALHAGLGVLLDEGLENVYAWHQACGDRLQAGLVERGFEQFAQEGHRLPELTSVRVPAERLPAGVDEAGVRRLLLERYDIEVAGQVWWIGCMGHTARQRNVTLLLGALDEILV